METKNLDYKNVTISGLPGAGSTTLAKSLADTIGWTYYSGGEFMRAYALEKGIFKPQRGVHHAATDYEDDFDRKIDYGVREKLINKKKGIYEAWLTGFLAQGIPEVLKVIVICSDDNIRVDRIVNRDQVDIVTAKHHIFEREAKNRQKWTRMYTKEWNEWIVEKGIVEPDDPIDFWDPRLYDLTIDTYSNSREETLQKVVNKLGFTSKNTG
jgi:cytidylate kinase